MQLRFVFTVGLMIAVLLGIGRAQAPVESADPASRNDDALILTLNWTGSEPNKSVPRSGINSVPDRCAIAHGVVACASLLLTLKNRGTEPIRTGLMTCGSIPIHFEVQQEDGSWRAIPHDPNKGWYCLRTFMEWHTIHSGEVYSLPIRIADDYTLDMKSLKTDHIVDVRVRWDVYGCAAADPPRPESSVPPPGTDMLLWRAQCVTGVKPSEAYVQLVSNTIKIDPKNR